MSIDHMLTFIRPKAILFLLAAITLAGILLAFYQTSWARWGTLCAQSQSPSGIFSLEARSSIFDFSSFFAMPGQGGCGQRAGHVILFDPAGRAIRWVATDDISTMDPVIWGSSSVSFRFFNRDVYEALWPLPPR